MPAIASLQRRIGVPNCDLPVAGMARSYARNRAGRLGFLRQPTLNRVSPTDYADCASG